MTRIISNILILVSVSCISAFTQGTGNFPGRNLRNALLPDKCYLKYIYEFPYESKPVFYSERYPDLETRNYLNADIIEPIFRRILHEGYKVFDPNWWGSIRELVNYGNLPAIDTSRILKYMHAGWDTNLSIDENSLISLLPVYNDPNLSDISGLFFFESWYLDPGKGFLNKEVIAYFPIYEYWDESSLEQGNQVKIKRLVCMIYQGEHDPVKSDRLMKGAGKKGYTCLYRGVKSEISLYNRPYTFYLHRGKDEHGATDTEFNEWEYHTFDFYKDFNTERFLEAIIDFTLDGRFTAEDPAMPGKILTKEEILAKISDNQNSKISYNDMNSVIFNEDWYFNTDSLYILKKVNSITILKHEYQFDEYTGDFLRVVKVPLITVSLK
jgi:hypothetical protein